jgi:hypothetical protein
MTKVVCEKDLDVCVDGVAKDKGLRVSEGHHTHSTYQYSGKRD